MSRMWLKNGRAVLADGRAALCDECPCDQGCSYTFYVDHSLAASGNGLTWATAFKNLNDAFANGTAINAALSANDCMIYVIIRGLVDYAIPRLGYPLFNRRVMIYLEGEDGAFVNYNYTGASNLIVPTCYYIIFKRWLFNLNIPDPALVDIWNSELLPSACYLDCVVNIDYVSPHVYDSPNVYIVENISAGNMVTQGFISGCTFNVTLTNFRNVQCIRSLVVTNTTLNVKCSTDEWRTSSCSYYGFIGDGTYNGAVANIESNNTWTERVDLAGFYPYGSSNSYYVNCGGNLTGTYDHGDYDHYLYYRCLFSGDRSKSGFFNCTQFCKVISDYASSNWCADYCGELT